MEGKEERKRKTGGKMNQNVFKTTERSGNIRVDSCGGARFVKESLPTERAVSRRKATTLKTPRRLGSVSRWNNLQCSSLGSQNDGIYVGPLDRSRTHAKQTCPTSTRSRNVQME